MSYEEEFDKIMREKAEGMDYPFDEAHWQKASKMIAESRSAASWTFGKIALGIVAVGGLSTALYFSAADLTSNKNEVASANVTVIAPSPISNPLPAQGEEHVETGTAPAAITPQSTGAKVSVDVQKTTSAVPEIKTAASKAPEKMVAGTPASAQAGEKSSFTPRTEDKTLGTTSVPLPAQPNNPVESADQKEEMFSADEAKSTASEEQFTLLDTKSSFLEYSEQQPEAMLPGLVIVKKRDDDYAKKTNKPITFFLDVVGGGAYNYGWENNGITDGCGASWFGGVNVAYFLGKRISVGSGIQAFNIGNMTQPFYSVQGKDYDFGSVTSKTVISCSQLMYIGVPLRFSYHLKRGDFFSLGLYASQLVNASTTVQRSVTQDEMGTTSTSENSNTIYHGMTPQLFMASAGYNVRVFSRLFVNAEVVYGLNSIYGPGTQQAGFSKPAGLRLGLTYRILEK